MAMKKPTLIATIVLVLIAGLIFGSFSKVESLTGYFSFGRGPSEGSISLSPSPRGDYKFYTGEKVTITVIPASRFSEAKGTENGVEFWTIGDIGQLRAYISNTEKYCIHGNVCTYEQHGEEIFKWRVPVSFASSISEKTRKYSAVIRDWKTDEKSAVNFEVYYDKPEGH
jgi:hypothetical protein